MRLGKSNLSAVEKITIVLMNLLHLPISALFHQDIILHIQAVYHMASAFNAQSDPGVVFKSFSASQTVTTAECAEVL